MCHHCGCRKVLTSRGRGGEAGADAGVFRWPEHTEDPYSPPGRTDGDMDAPIVDLGQSQDLVKAVLTSARWRRFRWPVVRYHHAADTRRPCDQRAWVLRPDA